MREDIRQGTQEVLGSALKGPMVEGSPWKSGLAHNLPALPVPSDGVVISTLHSGGTRRKSDATELHCLLMNADPALLGYLKFES